MARSTSALNIFTLLFLTLFASSTFAQTITSTVTANGTYSRPSPTNSGNVAATSSLVGGAPVPDAQYSAFFALILAIAGSVALGLGM